MFNANTTKKNYVPAIDGLRAIAVLSVLLYHLESAILPGGFCGVDIFFVISGYVISKSLHASKTGSLAAFILAFYKRRILRLVPALLFFLVSASLAASLFIPESWLGAANKDTAIWSFFGLSNFYLVDTADGYFSRRAPFNPFVHTWSLAVEEQFYVLFPILFYAWLTFSERSGLIRKVADRLLPGAALASFLFAAYESHVAPVSAFYLLPSRFWELASGAILFQLQTRGSARYEAFVRSVPLFMIGTLALAVTFMLGDGKRFPFPEASVPVLGALLLIAGATEPNRNGGRDRRLLEAPILVYIGRISYSLYLWHWGVFCLFRWTVGVSEPRSALLAVAVALGMAAFSYHVVENTFRTNRFLVHQPSWRIVAVGILALLTLREVARSVFDYRNATGLNLSVTVDASRWSSGALRPDLPKLTGRDGASGEGKKLFVIGDSHAVAYTYMAHVAAARIGATAEVFSRVGCPVANMFHAVANLESCRNIEEEVIAYLQRNAKRDDIVFLASLRVPRFVDVWGPVKMPRAFALYASPGSTEERRGALLEAGKFVDRLESMGLHVLIDEPKPVFRAPPFRCVDWFNRSNPICSAGFEMSRDELMKYRQPVVASLRELERSHGVILWDPLPVLCPRPVCSAFDGDTPIFIDGDHLSLHGDRLLIPSFVTALDRIWNGPSAKAAKGAVPISDKAS